MEKVTFQQVKKTISGNMYRLIDKGKGSSRKQKIIRFQVPCPHIDCFSWLRAQSSENKIYLADRNGEFEVAGVGIADLLKGDERCDYRKLFSSLHQGLSSDNKYLRYYGGLSFYNRKSAKEWDAFGSYCFIIPQFEVIKIKRKAFFAFNIRVDHINSLMIKKSLEDLERIMFSSGAFEGDIPPVSSLRNLPDRFVWERIFNEKISVSGEMLFDKIVLARKTSIDFEREVDPLVLFLRLREYARASFQYYFQPTNGIAFLGATPERLFKRNGLFVESEALAGTKPRGKNHEEDVFHQQKLSSSAKEDLEHRYVVDWIRNALSSVCVTLEPLGQRSIVKVSSALHLLTGFKGKLKRRISDADILSALHPTPAVGGYPLHKALAAIIKIEPFDRGWYTGPIGFVGFDYADFAVALRCALVRGENVSLFAGAGIVKGSTAEDEWQEIENKNSVYMRILEGQIKESLPV
jgi:menaquinone-specific isochorismate synthase